MVNDTQALATSESRKFLFSNLLVAGGTLLSRVTGFGRILALAYAIGLGGLSDVYNTANTTPNIIYELMLGGILSATLLPSFVRSLKQDDHQAISAVLSITTILLAGLTLVMILAAPLIMQIYSVTRSDHPQEFTAVGTSFVRLFMPQIFFYGLVSMATALLNAQHKFALPAYTPILNNMVVIGILVALPHMFGHGATLEMAAQNAMIVTYMGWGTTAGIMLSALSLLPAMLRSGVRLQFLPDWKHPEVQKVLRLSGWTLGYVIANQVALYIVSLVALHQEGWMTAYQTAFAFFVLPHGLLAMTIITTFMPKIAHDAASAHLPAMSDKMVQGLKILMLLMIPASVGYMLVATPLLVTLLNHGSFSLEAAHLTGGTLAMFALGLFPFSAYLFLMRGYYALSDTKTPFKLNVVENIINIALAVPFTQWMGVSGLAFSYSLAYCLSSLLTFYTLNKRVGYGLARLSLLGYFAKVVAVSLVMGLAVKAVLIELSAQAEWQQVAAAVIAGGIVYIVLTLGFKLVDLKALRR